MSLAVKPVQVAVLEEVALNKRKVWVASEDASENAEAIVKHVSATLYVLEVRKRGGSANSVFTFDFLKIKSYRMKTNTWHELRYEGEKKFALRFKEGDRNFQSFSDQLQVILKLHNKFTKPKYGEDFMKEVKMFKLERLKPVDKSNRGRPSDDEARRTSSTDSGVSSGSGSLQPGLPNGGNNSGESFAIRTLQHCGVNRKPKPQISPQKQPIAPRTANESRTIPRSVEEWRLPLERRESSDESHSDRASSIDEDPFYSASEHYSDSSTAELAERRQRATSSGPSPGRQSPAVNRPPPVPPRKCEDYVNNMEPGLGKLKLNTRTPPPPPPSKQKNDQRPKNVSLVRTKSDMPFSTTPSAAAAQGQQNQSLQRQTSLQDPSSSSSSSSVYGTAPSWRCVRCSLDNRALAARCAVCEWTRTDAWECRSCSTVYSMDVVHCQKCPAWRCRLCTFVNGGTKTDTTVCGACLQK